MGKIHLTDSHLFLVTIIEHQTKAAYDMALKLLRYIVLILTDYGMSRAGKWRNLQI